MEYLEEFLKKPLEEFAKESILGNVFKTSEGIPREITEGSPGRFSK